MNMPTSIFPAARAGCRRANALAALAMACGVAAAQTPLQGRDLDGNAATFEAYFDPDLNITWLADADLGNTLGLPNAGRLNWADANAMASTLNVFGVTGWRLPGVRPVNGSSFNLAFSNNGSTDRGYALNGAAWGLASELGHLFYVTLDNVAFSLANTQPFAHLAANDYWTRQADPSASNSAFFFNTGIGLQDVASTNFTYKVWFVRDGDVAAIPEPGTMVFMLAGGLAVLGLARRRRVL